jgi:hypothetical protein
MVFKVFPVLSMHITPKPESSKMLAIIYTCLKTLPEYINTRVYK